MIKMQKSIQYIKFGFMSCLGVFGMLFLKDQKLLSMSRAVFIVAALIMLVVYLTPEKYAYAK
jgi:hypothetical protein